jgi:iduronate 2-sulfatase
MRGVARVFLAPALAVLAVGACSGSGRTAHPNVLLILADDLTFRIGLYGDGPPTPNLERLARHGRRFDRAYCQYPLCSPSRTSLLTGWRPEKTQVWGNLRPPRELVSGATPLQEHFERNGYFTARVGKVYHSRFEDEFRWTTVVDTYDEAPPEEGPSAVWGPSSRKDEEEPDGRAARRTVELLAERRGKPFFIAVGFLKPHDPWIVPEPYFAAFPKETVEPPVVRDTAPIFGARRGATTEIPEGQQKDALAAYFASIAFMDAQLGVVLDAMDKLNLWRSTVVVFLGDNGFHAGEHGLWGKMTLFEESARVPLVVAAPGLLRAGEPTRQLAELVDVYPTLLELCRMPRVEGLGGSSLVPLLRNPDAPGKRAAFTMRKVGANRRGLVAQSVRTDRYRFIEWPEEGPELYDHDQDPGETRNLASDPAHLGTVNEMRAILGKPR